MLTVYVPLALPAPPSGDTYAGTWTYCGAMLMVKSPESPTTLDKNQESSFGGLKSNGKLRYAWAVDLGPLKPGR